MPSTKVISDIAGKVWKIEVAAGAKVAQDDAVLILESMKNGNSGVRALRGHRG